MKSVSQNINTVFAFPHKIKTPFKIICNILGILDSRCLRAFKDENMQLAMLLGSINPKAGGNSRILNRF